MIVCHYKTACEYLCIDFSTRYDATQCLRPQGITQKFWKQNFGATDEYLQRSCSRNSSGNVPNVYFNPNTGKVKVNLYGADNSNPTNGLRQKFLAKAPV